ncbi:DNA polymerase III subunit gamma/tau, partial [Salsipaludibacter albus]|uniref:DNA polymerase III subunit gamma/tau n=1 Tax=Salsipaludibacter albus TaxID=2849650 RepID=UPI001EE49A71|nr:DNA polymerase III subunit gamma/tau [Salsipaludibacter albus]
MAYVSLYRKYRPQTFDEVVGQDHVTRSLTNAIREDRLHHAYLFAGPRGTGKTSTARILAKSINCVDGPTPTPCNTCVQCVAITDGSSVDVIELDMASHGGVDDARELRDRAQFAPASARRKVYILDEVHMASTAAFNALLKLIEEPPGHVLFAMATTDPQKVLPTILSRVQRLDLRRVGAAEVAGRVRDLVAREGASIDDVAVDLVVRAGDGSVRDTESVLEQVLSYGDGTVTGEDVALVLGHTTFDHTAATIDAVMQGDLASAYVRVSDLLDQGTDLRQFTLDLVGHVRDLLVLAVAPDRPDLVDATADRRAALVAQAEGMARDDLARAIDDLAVALEQMRQGPARLALELALARIATRPGAPVPPPRPAAPVAEPAAGQAGADTAPDDEDAHDDANAADTGGADAPADDVEDEPASDEPGDAGPADAGPADDEPADDVVDDDDVATGHEADGQAEPDDVAPDEGSPADRADMVAGIVAPTDDEVTSDDEESDEGVTSDEATGDEATGDDVSGDDVGVAGGTDFASRAGARAERVAREGLPEVPADRPAGPEVEVETPPSTDESADLERIRSRWEAILELVRAESKRSHAIFEPADVERLRNGVLVLGYGERYRSFHADNAGRAEFADVLVEAIEQATGSRVRLDVRVQGDGPRRPRPKPMDAGPDGGGATPSDTPTPAAPDPDPVATAQADASGSG